MRRLVVLALLVTSCAHSDELGLSLLEGVAGGLAYAVGERALQQPSSSSSTDGGTR